MKVVKSDDFINFANVKGGNTFEHENAVYMKLSKEVLNVNAVRLATGDPVKFSGSTKVTEKEYQAVPV